MSHHVDGLASRDVLFEEYRERHVAAVEAQQVAGQVDVHQVVPDAVSAGADQAGVLDVPQVDQPDVGPRHFHLFTAQFHDEAVRCEAGAPRP